MMYTLALSLFVTGLVSVHCDCEDSWTRYGDSCYFFGHDDLTFHDAQRFCEHFSSNLTDINSSAENSFLRGYLTDLRAPKHWIGLSDEVVEGVWKVFPDGTDPKFLDGVITSQINIRAQIAPLYGLLLDTIGSMNHVKTDLNHCVKNQLTEIQCRLLGELTTP
ncbi:carbohydrate binding [Mactra antiquata]